MICAGDIGIKAAITKSHSGENDLMIEQLFDEVGQGDVPMLDRGSVSRAGRKVIGGRAEKCRRSNQRIGAFISAKSNAQKKWEKISARSADTREKIEISSLVIRKGLLLNLMPLG